MTVSGADSNWANSDSLDVGYDGSGSLTITDGGAVSNTTGYVGRSATSSGEVTVSGAGSTWENSDGTYRTLYVGYSGSGSLTIMDGGTVSNGAGYLGRYAGSSGAVSVSGAGSSWDNSSSLYVGYEDGGSLTISDGGAVSNTWGYVGYFADSSGEVTVNGAEAIWANSSTLYTGVSGAGSLAITNGGAVSNPYGYVGYFAESSGDVTVSGAGSTWANGDHLSVGHRGTGTLSITGGGAVSSGWHGLVGWADGADGAVTVAGAGSIWSCGSYNLYLGGGQFWNGSAYEYGGTGTGTLEIDSGGTVASSSGYLGYNAGASGEATVSGAGSTWDNSTSLYVGQLGTGVLSIQNGGEVSNSVGYVGYNTDSSGEVNVSGTGSTWGNSDWLSAGHYGNGSLTISDGGAVSNSLGYVGYNNDSSGEVTVSGTGSTWDNSTWMYVGLLGAGTLTIADGGAVSVGQELVVASGATSTGTVNLEGGSLTANSMAAGDGAANFNWSGGSLEITGNDGLTLDGGLLGPVVNVAGNKELNVSGDTTVASGVKLAVAGGSFSTETLDVSGKAQLLGGEIAISDTFTVAVDGELEMAGQDLALLNTPTVNGKLILDQTTLSAPSMTMVAGSSLDLDSGRISVDGTFTNQEVVRMGSAGAATIRADLLDNQGLLMGQGNLQAPVANTGNIALGGDSSFGGDVVNLSGGSILVSGRAAVTFLEDVDNQAGAEIRVSEGSSATYFGNLSGAGSFTGTGTNYIEGDLRPGASPATVFFGGDLVLGSGAELEIEIGGRIAGDEYDVLNLVGQATLGGTLDLVLIDDFLPAHGDSFTVMTFDSHQGDFAIYNGLSLPGGLRLEPNWTPTSLYLTAVPEPGELLLLASGALSLLVLVWRRRYKTQGKSADVAPILRC